MQIVVGILPEGKEIILEVESSDSVFTVKEKIKDKEGIPSEEQQLFYSGNLLLDSDVLANHNIKNSDILVVFVVQQESHRQSPQPKMETRQLHSDVQEFSIPYIPSKTEEKRVLLYCSDVQEISHVPIYFPSQTQMECRRSVIRRTVLSHPCTIM